MYLGKKLLGLILASGLGLVSGSVSAAGGLDGVPVVGKLLTNPASLLAFDNVPVAGDLIAAGNKALDSVPFVGDLLPVFGQFVALVPIPAGVLPNLEGLPIVGSLQ